MKKKRSNDRSSNEKLSWGIIIGFLGGVIFDNIALGLIVGVIIGSLPKVINKKINNKCGIYSFLKYPLIPVFLVLELVFKKV